jgi:hypothetical protein
LRELLIREAESNRVGFRSSELPEPLPQAQNPEYSGVDAKAHRGITTLRSQECRTADVSALGDHCGGEPAAQSGTLQILAQLTEGAPHCDGE